MLRQNNKPQITGSNSFRGRRRLQSRPGGIPESLSYVVEGNRLRLPGNPGGVRFAFPIGDVVETDEVIVVCLAIPKGSTCSENVYAVDHGGNLRWRIRPQSFPATPAPYVALSLSAGLLRLHSKDGQARDIDPRTGAVMPEAG